MRLPKAICEWRIWAFLSVASLTAVLGLSCGARPPCPQAPPPSLLVDQPPGAQAPAGGAAEGRPRTVVRQVNHVMDFGPFSLEVDATDGGRIVAFSLDGRSAVVSSTESPSAYGSSIWPSPQRDWQWPPPPAFDQLPWNTRVEDTTLVLESATDDKLQLAAEQRLTADPDAQLLRIDITLMNRGPNPRRVAPWQNTRVRPGGLTFYPSSRPAYERSSLKLEPQDGIVWFEHDPAKYRENLKLYGDGEEGWLAHVDGDLILVKTFPDVPEALQAPEEGEIILYVDGSGGFVEVEQQGAYSELGAGASKTWPVRWILRRVPDGVVVEPGSSGLVRFAREVVAAGAS